MVRLTFKYGDLKNIVFPVVLHVCYPRREEKVHEISTQGRVVLFNCGD